MEKRKKMNEIEPEAYQAMFAFEKYINSTAVIRTHRDLIKIRASQINGCAYCVDLHAYDARKAGEQEQRIYALTSWRETPFFSEEEKAVLALTEEVTLITGRVSDATYDNAVKILGEKYVAQVIMAIVGINAWNRIGVATELAPAVRVPAHLN
jgi:AhpD family alkylhydroperoxidase